jgi:hypothetical protein
MSMTQFLSFCSLAIQYCTLASNCGVRCPAHTSCLCALSLSTSVQCWLPFGITCETPGDLGSHQSINQSCTPAKRNIGLRGHPMLDSLVVSAKLTQGDIRMPLHVAVRKLPAQKKNSQVHSQMPCIVDVSRGSVITQKRRIVKFFAAREPNGHRGQQMLVLCCRAT